MANELTTWQVAGSPASPDGRAWEPAPYGRTSRATGPAGGRAPVGFGVVRARAAPPRVNVQAGSIPRRAYAWEQSERPRGDWSTEVAALTGHATQTIRPVKLLRDVRRSVSEILGKPFTERIDHQIFKPDQRLLAIWAAECAERVLPFFEERYPDDGRPRRAIGVLRDWIATGVFSMAVIREASLGAHAAAKGKTEADAAFAAHAAGQAAGTAHVVTHALGASTYGIRAVAAHSGSLDDGLKERDWQLERLREHVARKD